jgi:hypothetical protein
MSKGLKWTGLVVTLIGAVTVGQLWAGAAGANAAGGDEAAKDESTAGLEDVALAEQLADWGRENNHAAAVALAARIMSGVQQQPMDNAGKETEGAAAAASQPKEAAGDTAATLIAEAQQMAGDNDAAKAAVEAMGKLGVTAMGSTRGCIIHHDSVNARTTDVYRLAFRGGERAAVYVSGDGDTDLDLYVYDSNGNLIGADTDYSDECLVTWTPAWTGPFIIKIQNLGGVWNAYTLRTN